MKHFIIIFRDNCYRYPYLGESRTTTATMYIPITRAGGWLPCRPTNSCGYQQGEPSPYLVSRLLRRAQLSYNRISFGHEQVPGPPHTVGIHLTRCSAKILCAGTVGSPDFIPLRTSVARDPKAELRSRHQVEPRGFLLDISHLR